MQQVEPAGSSPVTLETLNLEALLPAVDRLFQHRHLWNHSWQYVAFGRYEVIVNYDSSVAHASQSKRIIHTDDTTLCRCYRTKVS